MRKFAILILDPKVLLEKRFFCCQFNAATERGAHIKSGSNIEIMFSGERDPKLQSFLTTDIQAEILIQDIVEFRFIKGVIFENQRDMDECRNVIPSNMKFKIDTNFFEAFFNVRGWNNGNKTSFY